MKTGIENWRGGCNAPGKPEKEGDIIRYRSPFNRHAILTDIGKIDRYGHLIWVAHIEDLDDHDPIEDSLMWLKYGR